MNRILKQIVIQKHYMLWFESGRTVTLSDNFGSHFQ